MKHILIAYVLLAFPMVAAGQTPASPSYPYDGSKVLKGVSLNGIINPDAFGIPAAAHAPAATMTGTITANISTLVLPAPTADFLPHQGVFLPHAGAPCGLTRGISCPAGPTPSSITPVGTKGATRYSYRLACIDGLGGVGVAGSPAVTTAGTSTLGVTNYNQVKWTGAPGCIEVAIYRNDKLVATEYSVPTPPTDTANTFNDILSGTFVHRDIPPAPPAAVLHDNLVTTIDSIEGSTIKLVAAPTVTLSGVTALHDDTAMLQAAIQAAGGKGLAGDGVSYQIHYPLNLTAVVTRTGSIQNLSILAQTGDIALDLTGQENLSLSGVGITSDATPASSTIGLFCSRDARSDAYLTSQNIYTSSVTINLKPVAQALGGKGAVGYYNYGCEIQQNLGLTIYADQLSVLTASNIWTVQSLFDPNHWPYPPAPFASMSQITYLQTTGSTESGAFFTLDSADSVNIFGGYFLGKSSAYPWGVELYGNIVPLNVSGLRTEYRQAGYHLNAHSILAGASIRSDVYHPGSSVAQIQMETGAVLNYSDITVDDYGGSGGPGPALLQSVDTACALQGDTFHPGQTQTMSFHCAPPLGVVAQSTVVSVQEGAKTYGEKPAGTSLASDASVPASFALGSASDRGAYLGCIAGYTCTSARGRLAYVGGSATTAGVIGILQFRKPFASPGPTCTVATNGTPTFYGVGWSLNTLSSINLTASVAMTSKTAIEIDYSCSQ